MYTKRLLCVVLFAFVALRPVESAGQEDTINFSRAARNKCIAEVGITNDLVEDMRRGNFPDDDGLKCYTACVMRVLNAVTPQGTLDFDKLVQTLGSIVDPEEYARAEVTIAHCRQIDYSTDLCEASYQYVRCYYNADSTFIFP